VILFSFKPRKRSVRTGYLFCPNCRRRTPGEMFVMTSRFYLLGFIPTGSVSESKSFLGCRQCGESFEEDGDWAFDFGDHIEPLLWDCRSCGEMNTNDRFHCRQCGKHI